MLSAASAVPAHWARVQAQAAAEQLPTVEALEQGGAGAPAVRVITVAQARRAARAARRMASAVVLDLGSAMREVMATTATAMTPMETIRPILAAPTMVMALMLMALPGMVEAEAATAAMVMEAVEAATAVMVTAAAEVAMVAVEAMAGVAGANAAETP